MLNNLPMVFRGARSLIRDIGHTAGYGVVYWYSMACAAAGSSECAAVHQMASDDSGRIGLALYDYVNDPDVRADVNYAISAAYNAQVHSDPAQAYLTGRIGLGVGMSYYTSPYGVGLAIMGLSGGALRASQTYGSGLQLNHVIEGAIGGGGP
ncbi:hypothetical protein [Microbulbifer halophilus]|uniref:Uncharacterized protein n=1 Tax=Microbulbifer halophilus TaxID=453963 RepID=A0ABW5ECC4_9GAMM|nr:hypothetical protein [Microbulbifer halophilus]MCW8126156.1 hypothetical protein [Microbulbifer halophilus]